MASDNKGRLRVLIVGGSIAGLALANMLEQTGIDYILLEKYQIAPQLGASIALLPNGLRILDQIGCGPAIRREVGQSDAFHDMQLRDPDGKLLSQGLGFGQSIERRLGYLPLALERRQLIQVLYDNLQNKANVLTNKSVVQIKQLHGKVQAVTAAGEVFTADILVGADGIHSAVRKEMWRQGKQDHPKSFSMESQSASIEYSCIFGMSKMKEGFPRDTSINAQGQGYAYLVMDGPQDTVFWFLFAKEAEKKRGLWDTIPRYTDAQKDALAAEHALDRLSETLTFGDLYKTQVMSTLQALPEVVFERWYNGRVFTIGDAAHKFNPIGGQGGSNAIEDAAVLTTHLANALKACDGRPISDDEVTAVFKKTQDERKPRAREFNDRSHMLQDINARATRFWSFVGSRVIPFIGMDFASFTLCESLRPAARVAQLRVKTPQFSDPWTDELPAKPWKTMLPLQGLSILASIGLTILAFTKIVGSTTPQEDIFDSSLQFLGTPLKQVYTGIPAIDTMFRLIVVVFSDAISWQDEGHTVQFLYLLVYLMPILVVWYVEGSRKGSSWTFISWPSVYALLMNLSGIGVIGPVYLVANALRDTCATYTSADRRGVPVPLAKWILPSILIGYGIPTFFMFRTTLNPEHHQILIVLWQFAAIAIGTLLLSFSWLGENLTTSKKTMKTQPFHFRDDDAVYLDRAYQFVFGLCWVFHLATGYWIASSTSELMSFSRLLIPTYSGAEPRPDTIASFMFTILRWDHLFAVAAFWMYGLFTILTMRGSGIIGSWTTVKTLVVFSAAHIVTGPGAALMGLWLWREKTMRLPVLGRAK